MFIRFFSEQEEALLILPAEGLAGYDLVYKQLAFQRTCRATTSYPISIVFKELARTEAGHSDEGSFAKGARSYDVGWEANQLVLL